MSFIAWMQTTCTGCFYCYRVFIFKSTHNGVIMLSLVEFLVAEVEDGGWLTSNVGLFDSLSIVGFHGL
jgi:hypothetical protein